MKRIDWTLVVIALVLDVVVFALLRFGVGLSWWASLALIVALDVNRLSDNVMDEARR